jgi:hypothetical protein
MESARLALYGGVGSSDLPPIPTYDYFVFVNCGVTGPGERNPPPPSSSSSSSSGGGARRRPWTHHFVDLLDEEVRMTGLTLNCGTRARDVHVQSMMYAVDRVGLDVIMKSGAVHDCLMRTEGNRDFINHYERKMGRAILDAGYGLRPLIRHRADMHVTKSNVRDCAPCGSEMLPDPKVLENNATTGLLSPTCEEREYYRDIWIGSR